MSAEVIEGVGDVVDVADDIAADMTAAAACYQVGAVTKVAVFITVQANPLFHLCLGMHLQPSQVQGPF